jgi:hypothetical protein
MISSPAKARRRWNATYRMLINRQEISAPGGDPVEVDHIIDHAARIRSRLDAIAKRPPASENTYALLWLGRSR